MYKDLINDSIKEKADNDLRDKLLKDIFKEYRKIIKIRKQIGAGFISKRDAVKRIAAEGNIGIEFVDSSLNDFVKRDTITIEFADIYKYINQKEDFRNNCIFASVIITIFIMFMISIFYSKI